MKQPRPQTLFPELERLLSTRPATVGEAIRRVVADIRPCVRLETTRATGEPLRQSMMKRLLGRSPGVPVLAPTASKLGGIPYIETVGELGGRFIGQINFAEASTALAMGGFQLPEGMPNKGLLAVDLTAGTFSGRVRWYPDPHESRAVDPGSIDTVAKYEAKVQFRGSWSLRGLAWFDDVPKGDEELWNYLNDLEVPGVDEDARDGHKLFGHPNEALNEHYGFDPVPGRSSAIADYALVWRINYDNAAGFAWGTNWLYVVIHLDDLARGSFEHAVVTGANA